MAEKLEIIESSLVSLRDDIAVVTCLSDLNLNPEDFLRGGDMGQAMHFHLAPHEPIYKARTLDNLRKRIAPELEPYFQTRSYGTPYGFGSLRLGCTKYKEAIGSAIIKGICDLKSQTSAFEDDDTPDFAFEVPLERTITVRLFPNARLAAAAEATDYTYTWMSSGEVRQAKRDYRRFGLLAVQDI